MFMSLYVRQQINGSAHHASIVDESKTQMYLSRMKERVAAHERGDYVENKL